MQNHLQTLYYPKVPYEELKYSTSTSTLLSKLINWKNARGNYSLCVIEKILISQVASYCIIIKIRFRYLN